MTTWADPATIRGRQRQAHAVLGRLLDLDLPTPHWHIGTVYLADTGRSAKLEGQLGGPHEEARKLTAVPS